MKKTILKCGVIVALSILLGCGKETKTLKKPVYAPPDYWPTAAWRTSTPEQQGMDSQLLAEAVEFIMEEDFHVHSMLIIRNGYIVADTYFYPFTPDTPHDIASCTKSFTSTLIGTAVAGGYINSVRQPVLAFFPERTVSNMDENKKAMTLEDLLTMRTGLACYGNDNETTLFQMMASPDWTQFMLDLPMIERPGTRFQYCSGGSHLLSAIIRQTTGMSELDFGREHLFGPLGISDVGWPYDPQGENNHGWGDLRLKPHDMAKLGYLFLNGGAWDGKQIVPSQWVERATGKIVPLSSRDFFDYYGYQWWIGSRGFYAARGRGGQIIFVAPGLNMVAVLTGGDSSREADEKRQELAEKFLFPAVKTNGPLPANDEGVARLRSEAQQAAMSPPSEKTPAKPLPQMAGDISGRTYSIEANRFGLQSFSLSFPDQQQALFRLNLRSDAAESKTLDLAVGLDNTCRISPGRFGIPAALKGRWEKDDLFVIHMDEVGNINRWTITMAFEGDDVKIGMKEHTGLGEASFRAHAVH